MDEHVMREDFEKAYEELDEGDKAEFDSLAKELDKCDNGDDSSIIIEDKNLKRRIAQICLKLVEETPKQEIPIMETSYIITGYFVRYNYGDQLDGIMDIFSELELPVEHLSMDIFKLWDIALSRLKRYLR